MIARQRTAVSIAFLAFGVTVGGLIPRIPALKDHLHLTDGQVGIALLGASLGGIAGVLASRLVIRRGASRYVRLGLLALCVVAVGPALAANLVALVASLFTVGFLWGFMDTLDNALGAQLERIEGKPLINGFHGFWSLGAFLGSLVAGAAAFIGVGPMQQFVATGVVIAIASAWFLSFLPDFVPKAAEGPRRRGWTSSPLTGPIIAVAAISFAGIIAEGGTSDWSALYLRDLSHASAGTAAAGFSGFALAAMLVRFRADLLTARTGRATVTRIGALVAVVGLALAIAFPVLPVAVAGFALVGMGTAVVLPLAFAAGANLGQSGTSLALVMASAYAGTIAGPPLIGTMADHFGLRLAMAVPLVAALAVLAAAAKMAAAEQPTGDLRESAEATMSKGASG
ncbi:MAG: MFS transporter [Chloroflexi bacterium]|nr:MAG: MFS transporter [Chloroflexota bacterium]